MVFALKVKRIDNFAEEMLVLLKLLVVGVGFEEPVVNGHGYFFVLIGNDVNFVFQHRVFVFLLFLFPC